MGTQLGHRHVVDGLEQAALVVDQQHDRIVRIDDRTGAVEVGDSVGDAHGYSPIAGLGLAGSLGGGVAADQVAVVGDVVGEQRSQPLDVVAPIAMQFAGETKPGHQLGAGLRHAIPGRMAGDFVERA
ncbi:hypothetical protein D3C71_1808910 [compost metagenome]